MIRYRGDCAGVLQVQRSRGGADVEVQKQKCRGLCAGLLHVQVHLQMQRCKYGGSEVLRSCVGVQRYTYRGAELLKGI